MRFMKLLGEKMLSDLILILHSVGGSWKTCLKVSISWMICLSSGYAQGMGWGVEGFVSTSRLGGLIISLNTGDAWGALELWTVGVTDFRSGCWGFGFEGDFSFFGFNFYDMSTDLTDFIISWGSASCTFVSSSYLTSLSSCSNALGGCSTFFGIGFTSTGVISTSTSFLFLADGFGALWSM